MDIGSTAFGLAADGGTLWVGATEAGELLAVDTTTRTVTARHVAGRAVLDVAVGGGAAWAVSALDGTVTRVGDETTVIAVDERPYACIWALDHLWVSNGRSGTVTKIDGDGTVVETIVVGGEPNGLAEHHGRIFVAEREQGRVIALGGPQQELEGADWITPHGDALWVSREPNLVSELDARTLEVRRTIEVGANPLGSLVVGDELWLPCIEGNAVEAIGLETGDRRSVAEAEGPIMLAHAGKGVWVACWESRELVVLPSPLR